ncbi:tyrosine-type recombinase/integrase [Streptomyces sp. NPDC005125]
MILSDPIKKLPPNAKGQVRYRFVVDVGIDPATGKREQLTRTFDTLKEAKAEYARLTNRRHEGTFVPPNKITVNEWLDQWLAKKTEDLQETTIYNYAVTLDRVRGKLGHIRLQELTEDHVETWMTWALQGGRGDLGRDVPRAAEGLTQPDGDAAHGRSERCPRGHDPSEGTQGGVQNQDDGAALERSGGSCLRARGEG